VWMGPRPNAFHPRRVWWLVGPRGLVVNVWWMERALNGSGGLVWSASVVVQSPPAASQLWFVGNGVEVGVWKWLLRPRPREVTSVRGMFTIGGCFGDVGTVRITLCCWWRRTDWPIGAGQCAHHWLLVVVKCCGRHWTCNMRRELVTQYRHGSCYWRASAIPRRRDCENGRRRFCCVRLLMAVDVVGSVVAREVKLWAWTHTTALCVRRSSHR